MRFIVTGAGGFLGRHLVNHLLAFTSHDVVAATSQSSAIVVRQIAACDDPGLNALKRLQFIDNYELLGPTVLGRADVVLHCAFPWNRGGLELSKGLRFQRDLFRRANEKEVQTFVNVSSQSVYSRFRTSPASENDEVDCDSIYATAKYGTELLAGEVLNSGVLVNVRMGSLIGRGYDIRIVNRLIRRALAGSEIIVEGGSQAFSFMDVRDACSALATIGEVGVNPGAPVVNVGSDESATLLEIADMVAGAVSRIAEVEVSVRVVPSENGQDGTARYALDCRLAHSIYGFRQTLTLAQSIEWIAEAYIEN